MSDDTYEDLLSKGWDEVPEEILIPNGHWIFEGVGLSFNPGTEKRKPQLSFVYEPIFPQDDVSEEALADLGDYDFTANRVYFRIMVENDADRRRVQKHLKLHVGFELPAGSGLVVDGKITEEAKRAFRGSRVVAIAGKRSYTNRNGELVTETDLTSFTTLSDD